VLRAEGLFKSFGSLAVARNVSLALERGARHALIGPNGAGKTTLFNMLSGETRPDAGRVYFGSRDITAEPPDARARSGIARSFQRNSLFDDMTARDNLVCAALLARGLGGIFWRNLRDFPEVYEKADDIAALVGLSDSADRPARSLAYGLQRQLEVGLALALDPVVLLLDEPTAGMSPEETRAMRALLAGLPGELTLLVVEHDMDVVFDIAERITVLDAGTVLFEGTPAEVRASPEVRARYLGHPT
jgi:branched-chain amino acid transport system ATP-binding protein